MLSYGYTERYCDTFSALIVPGSEKQVNRKSKMATPTANMLVYLQTIYRVQNKRNYHLKEGDKQK